VNCSWSVNTSIVSHPTGKGFAIVVTLIRVNSKYRVIITKTGNILDGVPNGHADARLALRFLDYYDAQAALEDVQQRLTRDGLAGSGLWPRCVNCLGCLSVGAEGIIAHCPECGHDNPL